LRKANGFSGQGGLQGFSGVGGEKDQNQGNGKLVLPRAAWEKMYESFSMTLIIAQPKPDIRKEMRQEDWKTPSLAALRKRTRGRSFRFPDRQGHSPNPTAIQHQSRSTKSLICKRFLPNATHQTRNLTLSINTTSDQPLHPSPAKNIHLLNFGRSSRNSRSQESSTLLRRKYTDYYEYSRNCWCSPVGRFPAQKRELPVRCLEKQERERERRCLSPGRR